MYIDRSWFFDLLHYYIHQCLGLVLWNTEVLTEGLPLLYSVFYLAVSFFSIVIFIMWTFSTNKHMDGWMDVSDWTTIGSAVKQFQKQMRKAEVAT